MRTPAVTAPAVSAETVDLRLAFAATAAWIVLAVCLGKTPSSVFTVAAVAAGIAVIGCVLAFWARTNWLPGRHTRTLARVIGLLGGAVALVLVPAAGRMWSAQHSEVYHRAEQGGSASVRLVVGTDPRTLTPTGDNGAVRVVLTGRTNQIQVSGRWVSSAVAVVVIAPVEGWQGVLPGQRVAVDGSLAPSTTDTSAVVLFAHTAPELIGAPPWWQRAAGSVRADLRAACARLPPDVRGLLPGLVVGDTSGLDPVLASDFRRAGMTHLVAVSGTNCSIVVGVVLLLLRRTRTKRWMRALIAAALLVCFVVVARPSPSVLRAAVMAALLLTTLGSGRPRRALPALGAAVLVLLLWQPALARDFGFAMSVTATAALVLIAPGWADWLRAHRVPPVVAESLAVATAAHVVTAPIIAWLAGQVSLVAIPANALAEPLVAPATVVGFTAALVAPLSHPGGVALAWLAGWPCRGLVQIAGHFGSMESGVLAWPSGARGAVLMIIILLAVVAICRHRIGRAALAAAALVALAIQIPGRTLIDGWPPRGWLMVACDVGEGDGLVLNAGPGVAVVVDTGPDPAVMDSCLRSLGITRVALLVISHFHLDHVGGVIGVYHGRTVDRVIAGPLPEPIAGLRLLEDTAHTNPVHTPAVGTTYQVGAVQLRVVGPNTVLHDTHSDPNNNSLLLLAQISGVRILLLGDAEIDEEQRVLEARTDIHADVLKVAHHGSSYFDPAFYMAAHARVAVISVGAGNSYGHPAPRTLAQLSTLGLAVARTDQDGTVALTGSRAALRVVTQHRVSAYRSVLERPAVREDATGPDRVGTVQVLWRAGRGAAVWSPVFATMTPCPRVRSPSMTYLPRFPGCSSWSARKSCSSPGLSARSPPLPDGPTRAQSRPSWPARISRVPNCTS